jgi:hypothetical protein
MNFWFLLNLRFFLGIAHFFYQPNFQDDKYGPDKDGTQRILIVPVFKSLVCNHQAQKNAYVIKYIKGYFFAHGSINSNGRIYFLGPG